MIGFLTSREDADYTYRVSAIPTDLALALSTSVVLGMYLSAPMRFACSMKLVPYVSWWWETVQWERTRDRNP